MKTQCASSMMKMKEGDHGTVHNGIVQPALQYI